MLLEQRTCDENMNLHMLIGLYLAGIYSSLSNIKTVKYAYVKV